MFVCVPFVLLMKKSQLGTFLVCMWMNFGYFVIFNTKSIGRLAFHKTKS